MKLLQIDETTVDDHWYIELEEDTCYYLGVYTSHTNYEYSPVNSIISNFKKKPSAANTPAYKWKLLDIKKVAKYFNEAVNPDFVEEVTFIPVPPSKAKDHPDYDDRLIQILNLAFPSASADIRELVEQIKSTESVHSQDIRPSINEIKKNLQINPNLVDGTRGRIVIFDDVLTTGAHYQAMKELLQQQFPEAEIMGFFFSRRVFV